MFFQIGMGGLSIIIVIVALILVSMLILKISLVLTKAPEKRNMKWVALSFLIQSGIVAFVSAPLLLIGAIGGFQYGPPVGLIIFTVIFSGFIVLHVINVIHKTGPRRALAITIVLILPISAAMTLLGMTLGNMF